jgi:hypothetical protein
MIKKDVPPITSIMAIAGAIIENPVSIVRIIEIAASIKTMAPPPQTNVGTSTYICSGYLRRMVNSTTELALLA